MRCARGCLRKRPVLWVFLVLSAALLASCSLFESGIKVPVVKKQVIVPESAPCDQPYCTTDLDYPIYSVKNPKLYVWKSERRLWIIEDKTLVREYQVGLGPCPTGDKVFQGDGRTPEGEFFIAKKKPDSQYYKSLGINYPAPRHAENALLSGKISKTDYRSIIEANENKRMPPANTPLGGLIFIHGGGCYPDWTKGCIAVPNRAMDELFEIVSVGTPVYILP